MLSQGWFWIALFALLLTAQVDFLKALFCLGLGIDLTVWFWGVLKAAFRPFRQAAEARERERQHLIDCAENEKRQEKERAHKLELEREATKRQLLLMREQVVERQRRAEGNDLVIAAQQCEAMKKLVDKLGLAEDDVEALKLSIDRKLFRMLKGRIDGE
jgi:uncharacterized protein YlxW (UPF0749 family)